MGACECCYTPPLEYAKDNKNGITDCGGLRSCPPIGSLVGSMDLRTLHLVGEWRCGLYAG